MYVLKIQNLALCRWRENVDGRIAMFSAAATGHGVLPQRPAQRQSPADSQGRARVFGLRNDGRSASQQAVGDDVILILQLSYIYSTSIHTYSVLYNTFIYTYSTIYIQY